MSVRSRWLTAALAVVLWCLWLVCNWAGRSYPVGTGHQVAEDVLRLLAVLSSIFLMLAFLVRPVIETARVWRDIGRREQERNCKCSERRMAVNGDVIPLNRVKRRSFSDN